MITELLYIEDNPYSVHLMQLYLRRKSNYVLHVATDALSGWQYALAHKPDLILMDINLPDMSGWDLSDKLKHHPVTREIPIIAVTSLTMRQNYEKSLQVGIDLHLSKTTRHAQLFQHVDEMVNNRQSA